MAGMLKDAKVDGLFVRLNSVADSLIGLRVDPADEVALRGLETTPRQRITCLAVYLDHLHAGHVDGPGARIQATRFAVGLDGGF